MFDTGAATVNDRRLSQFEIGDFDDWIVCAAANRQRQIGQVSGLSTTGIRLCSSAQSSFGVVVAIVKLRIRSPAGERQVSHNPAMAMRPPPLRPIA